MRTHILGSLSRPLRIVVLALLATGMLLGLACSSGDDTATPTPAATQTPPVTPRATLDAEWTPDGIISAREYGNSETYGDYEIHWSSDEQYVYIGMRAKASGFVAVGFQPGSRMKDADIVLGFVKDGQVSVLDTFSTGDFGPHPPDTDLGGTQDIADFGGREEGGFTTIEFKRALDTGDDYDNPVSAGGNSIIWAFSSSDSDTFKHARKGYGELTL